MRIAAWQSEDDHRRGAGTAEEAGHDAGRRRDILLGADLVADDAATDRAAGIEAVERLTVTGIDDQEIVVEIAGEQHIARRDRDAGDERRRPLLAPTHLSGPGINRLQPALRLVARVGVDRAAVIVRVQREFRRLVQLLERAAPVDGGDKQRVGLRIVGRAVPFHAPEQARTDMRAAH